MLNRRIYKGLSAAGLALAMAACATPQFAQRAVNRTVPATYNKSTQDTTSTAQVRWKEFFTDPNLAALIDTALLRNQELNVTLQEIQIARNEIQARKGEYLPVLGLGVRADLEKPGRYTLQGATEEAINIQDDRRTPTPLANYQLGAFASWEVDIWHKLRNARKSAATRYLASIEGKNFMVTNLIAEIANSYYELLALDNQLAIVQQNIGIQENALRIVKLEMQSAKVTELAVQRFEAQVQNTTSLQYKIKQRITETENKINFLAGRYPQPIVRDAQAFAALVSPTVRAGVPAQLLSNRPDIRQAEQQLIAAKLDVQVARANFYPSLGLSGGVGFEAFKPGLVFTSPESMLYNLAGSFSSTTLSIGPLTLTNTTNTGILYDMFVAKLVDNGTSCTVAWVRQAGSTGDESATALAVSGNNLYLVGSLNGAALTLDNTTLAPVGLLDSFVAKLVDNGSTATFAWAVPLASAGHDFATTIAVRGSRVYVSSSCNGPTLAVGPTTTTLPANTGLFVAAIDDTGPTASVGWLTTMTGLGYPSDAALATNGTALYLAGRFNSPTIQLGALTLTNASANLPTSYDGFVAKLTDTGNAGTFQWGQRIGNTSDDAVTALALSGQTVYLAGNFQDGPVSFGPTTLPNEGLSDGFVAKLTDAGSSSSFNGAQAFGGLYHDESNGMLVSGTTVYITGSVLPSASFGSQTIATPLTMQTGFIATLSDQALATTATTAALPGLVLAPNPARTATTVTLPAQPGSAMATLTLHDALGRCVQATTVAVPATGLRHELSVAGQPAGLYHLQVQTASGTATRQLVVE